GSTRSPRGTTPAAPRGRSSRLLSYPAVAVDELLVGAPRGRVVLGAGVDLPEGRPELVVQGLGIVTRHLEPAAFLGALETEGRDDDVTVHLQRAAHGRHVGPAVLLRGEEVEDRPVVPEREALLRKRHPRHVTHEPGHGIGALSESRPGAFD